MFRQRLHALDATLNQFDENTQEMRKSYLVKRMKRVRQSCNEQSEHYYDAKFDDTLKRTVSNITWSITGVLSLYILVGMIIFHSH